jgi:hypothetical protein
MTGTTDFYRGFRDCTSLTSLPLFDTSLVTRATEMFYSNSSLTSLPLFDLSSCVTMNGFVQLCSSLTSVPLFDLSSATILNDSFRQSGLTSCPTFDLSSMTNGQSMFLNTNIGTASWDALLIATEANNANPNVTWSGGNAEYASGSKARQLLVDRGWTMTDGGNSPTIFASEWLTTTANETITIPVEAGGTYTDVVVDWGDGTTDTINSPTDLAWTHTYVDSGTQYVKMTATVLKGFRFNSGGDKLKITNISNWGSLNLGNNGSYFDGCSNLNLIGAGTDLDMTGTTTLSRAFQVNSSLTAIPLIDTSLVINMSRTFNSCSKLIELPLFVTSNVTTMESMCRNCIVLESVALLDTSNVTDIREAWLSNVALTLFPTIDLSSMTLGSQMLHNSNIGTASWDALLIATEANNTNEPVTWSGGNAQYTKAPSDAATARAALEARTSPWVITDGGATP